MHASVVIVEEILVKTFSISFSQYLSCRADLLFVYKWAVIATGKSIEVEWP
jgi:hypothetical protein